MRHFSAYKLRFCHIPTPPCLNKSRHAVFLLTSIGLAVAHFVAQSPSAPLASCVICLLFSAKGDTNVNSYRVSNSGIVQRRPGRESATGTGGRSSRRQAGRRRRSPGTSRRSPRRISDARETPAPRSLRGTCGRTGTSRCTTAGATTATTRTS